MTNAILLILLSVVGAFFVPSALAGRAVPEKGSYRDASPVGCEGSGTLVEAPITSAIDVVIDPTGAVPEKGTYALARFTSGGELLANWTVTINGTPTTSLSMGNMTVALKRDATGIWLNVHKTGLFVICRYEYGKNNAV